MKHEWDHFEIVESFAGMALTDVKATETDVKALLQAQNKARQVVKAFAQEPLLLLSQTSSTTVGLDIGTWNIRAYVPMHDLPSDADQTHK